MELLTCLILYGLILLIPLFYWNYSRSKFRYWSDRGIKGPVPIPIMGTLIEMYFKQKRTEEVKSLKKYGKIYGGNTPVLTVAEPELIKNILVKDFHIFTDRQMPGFFQNHPILSKNLAFIAGQDWKRLRSIVSPTFTSGKMRKMYHLIRECVEEFVEVLEEYANEGRPINMRDMFGNYSMDVIATCAFATKSDTHRDPNNPFVQNAAEIFNPKPYRIIPMILFPNLISKLPNFLLELLNLKFSSNESANQFFFDTTRHVINERKSSNEKHNDFIQMLLNAMKSDENTKHVLVRDDTDLNESHHVNEGAEELSVEESVFRGLSNKFITEDEILAQSWLFFSSGYETTANTMAFASYELAINEDSQQRLYEEIMTAVDTKGDIDYDKLTKLPYLDSVISETLRLHSPAMKLTRMAAQDYKLGTTGITLFKGQSVEIPIYAIHHSEEYYKNPEEFDPTRFMPHNRHKLIPYTYLPFGAGPRGCVGMRFALMEAKLGLAQIIKKFKINMCSETTVPIVYRNLPGLNSPKRLILGIQKRL